jgi:hypothetical protein
MNCKRTVWPTGLRNRILKSLDSARNRGKRGELTMLYGKYGITPQHEQQWRAAQTVLTAEETSTV